MNIFLITGMSGAGKTTIAQGLQNRGLWLECVSHTTRPIRLKDGEEEGKTYYYINKEEFQTMLDNNEFAEHVEYDGNLYGISKREIDEVMSKGKDVYIIVDYDGYLQVKEQYPEAIGIFIYMSKEDCMANMLIRGDSYENAQKRISTYDEEIKNKEHYDYVVKNVRGKVEETKNIVSNIVKQYKKESNNSIIIDGRLPDFLTESYGVDVSSNYKK